MLTMYALQSSGATPLHQLDGLNLERLISLLSASTTRTSEIATQVLAQYCQCANMVCKATDILLCCLHLCLYLSNITSQTMSAGGSGTARSGPKRSLSADAAAPVSERRPGSSSDSPWPHDKQQHQDGSAMYCTSTLAAQPAVTAEALKASSAPCCLCLSAQHLFDA